MSFAEAFHEIIPGYRVSGRVLVTAVRGIKDGGIGSGSKTLEIGNFGLQGLSLIEAAEGDRVPSGFVGVESIDDVYEMLSLSGLSTVVSDVLVNPASIALLEYGDNFITADAVGSGGRFNFERNTSSGQWSRDGFMFKVPDAQFDAFKEAVLSRLSTLVETQAEVSNSYIALDGSNDYVEFTTKGAENVGLLDWAQSWSVGINLVDFEVLGDQQYITLFSSGSNAIMLRRGGSNYAMYITGNNGSTKIGANTWYAPVGGGKLLFTYSSTSNRLKYYIIQPDGIWAQRANYLVNIGNIGGNAPGTNFCIGKPVTNSVYYHGGLNNLIVAAEELAGPIITEYAQVSETYDESSFYADLTSWAKFGEDTFPAVVDTKGVMTDGTLVNGQPDDFVVIEPPSPTPPTSVTTTDLAYTPNYAFVGTSHTASYQNLSGGDAMFDDYAVEKIEISPSFLTMHFVTGFDMDNWRSTGRSVDLTPAVTKSWSGTKTLGSSTEYSVSTQYSYVHYSWSQMGLSSAEFNELSRYVAEAGVGVSVLDMSFE